MHGRHAFGAEHASLSFASQPTWTVRATDRRERGKDLHRVHELHLPWACDGISTLELNVRQDSVCMNHASSGICLAGDPEAP